MATKCSCRARTIRSGRRLRTLNGGKVVHYPCRPENNFVPDPEEIARLVTKRTRAIVVINPNNPTGAVHPRAVLEAITSIAERSSLVVFADEIYDQMTYDGNEFIPMATLVKDTLCATLSGLSKVYRACGYRVGWASFSGRKSGAAGLLRRAGAAELAPSVQQRAGSVGRADRARRLSEHQGSRVARRAPFRIAPCDCERGCEQPLPRRAADAGRDVCVHRREDRRAAGLRRSAVRSRPAGAEARAHRPGSSFNVPYRNRFRVTNLPDATTLRDVFGRIEELLTAYASGQRESGKPAQPRPNVVEARERFR